jgi:hypothetical protein
MILFNIKYHIFFTPKSIHKKTKIVVWVVFTLIDSL